MKKINRLLATGALVLSMLTVSVQPVYAADDSAFKGWDEETKEDAWTVYAITDWTVFSKELIFGKAKGGAKAKGISSAVEMNRDRIKSILAGMDESYGIYPNESYTELMLCLIQVLSNGSPDANDPAQVCKYINPRIPPQSMSFDRSIKELFKRLSKCEAAHAGQANLYVNDSKLQSILQGVVFSPTYTKENVDYTTENAEAYKNSNEDKLYGNPSPYFAQKVAEHYNCTSVGGYFGNDYATEDMKRIADIARNNMGNYPCTPDYCAAWVTGVYQAAGANTIPYGNAIDMWNNYKDTGSTDMNNIPVGAIVCGSGSGPMGAIYGHVGVYIGDGLVAHNAGYHSIQTVDEWASWQTAVCQGHQGWIGWVFPGGVPSI